MLSNAAMLERLSPASAARASAGREPAGIDKNKRSAASRAPGWRSDFDFREAACRPVYNDGIYPLHILLFVFCSGLGLV